MSYSPKGTKKMSQSLICYCFNYTADDIKSDFKENGQSTIMARIANEKKNGKCNCESTNPKGR
jgi:hypothetical protein